MKTEERNTYHGFNVGDRVTVKHSELDYGNKPFNPGDTFEIMAFPPKVRIIKRPPTNDGLDYFIYGKRVDGEGIGINVVNAQKVEK